MTDTQDAPRSTSSVTWRSRRTPKVVTVYTDVEQFSSCNSLTGPFPGLPVTPEGDDANDVIDQCRSSFPMSEYIVPGLDVIAAMTPVRRTGHVEDIAAATVFLCSDDAGFITGQSINVNGGLYM